VTKHICDTDTLRRAALARYPFSKEAYTQRARDLLDRSLEETGSP